ncbi:unnamed protein product [Caenorhabditis auriculariae]|uniref:Uncharacterized protein n=1 Tax=Caenorhabditis auriculariae TaxID=2777116 RepID=A0A8S1HAC2_9PELO|nr:unnamed protein product [Caenorhabditis auriculariae]
MLIRYLVTAILFGAASSIDLDCITCDMIECGKGFKCVTVKGAPECHAVEGGSPGGHHPGNPGGGKPHDGHHPGSHGGGKTSPWKNLTIHMAHA